MKVLIDMNLSPRWQAAMMEAGIGAVHWSEVGDHESADSVLATYALSSGLIVLTQDLDFGALLAASGDSAPVWYRFAQAIPRLRESGNRSFCASQLSGSIAVVKHLLRRHGFFGSTQELVALLNQILASTTQAPTIHRFE